MPAMMMKGALAERMRNLPSRKKRAREQFQRFGGKLAGAPGGPAMGKPGGGGAGMPVSAAVMPQEEIRKGSLDIAEGASGMGQGVGTGGFRKMPAEGTAVQPGTTPAAPEVAAAEAQAPANVARPVPGAEAPIPGAGAVPRGVQDAGAGAGGPPMAEAGLRGRLARQMARGRAAGPAGFGMMAPGQVGGTQGPGGRQAIQQYMANRGAMPAFQMAQRPKRRNRFFTGGMR